MTGLVVLGTGGHARSCLDVMDAAGVPVLGCIGGPPQGQLQAPFLGGDAELENYRGHPVFVAIGDNRKRRELATALSAAGWTLPVVVSPFSRVAPTAALGPGTIVMHSGVVGPYSTLGQGTIINTGASVDHDCTVGDFVHIAPGTNLAGTVSVGEGSFLGVGVSVIPETQIGEWVTVGAGACVVRGIEGGATVVGVPARNKAANR